MLQALVKKIFNQQAHSPSPTQSTIVKSADIMRGYQREASITRYLPWRDYNDKYRLFLLEDNKSLATCFRLTPIPCEARPTEMLNEISKALGEAIKNSIPCEKNNPWILQVFVERHSDLSAHMTTIENSIAEEHQQSPLTQAHLKTLKEHLAYVTRPGGIFFDRQVTNQIFRGGYLNVYAILYRRISQSSDNNNRRDHVEDIIRVSRKFADQLRACGLKVKRLRGEDFYHWMVRWFNPKPRQTNGDINTLITQATFPKPTEKPFGWDLTENIFFSSPESYEEGWLFDGLPHKVMTIQSLTANPAIGHLSAERKRSTDDRVFNLIDHLPENSVFSMSIVLQAPSEVEFHLKTIHDSAVGRHAQAMKVKTEVEQGFQSIANGDYLFPTVMALYLRGENFEDLREKEAHAEVLLNSNGFKVISDDELYPIDAYLRYLPMCYDFHFDKRNSHRSRYILLSDIAKLLPFYGRSRGTENPGFIGFNRGGEPWYYDILKDKTKNAHFLLLGETGTGKSNLLNFLAMHMLALYKPRLFIIEAGGSFDLLADYCASFGLTINKIKIDPKNPISLNPFAQGLKVLDQIAELDRDAKSRFLEQASDKLIQEQEENKKHETAASEVDDESRDILGDMVLAALVMITGGERKEEDRITRSDRMLIMDAIIDAATYVRDQGGSQMIASDLVDAFDRIAQMLDIQRDADKIRRAREMADGLKYFTKDPVSSRFFNTVGEPWALADVTVVDFGLFAQEGYEAQRSIAFAGCVSKMLTLADANQYSNRAIISIFDENHLFSKLPLLAAIQTRIAKMGRKLGLWIWTATQNLKDFAEEASKMLSLTETWMCLALPPDEIDQIERFKTLTKEQRALFLSAQKEKGKYTEGVLLSPKVQDLFRNVPPRLYLVMAGTDQDEKNLRKTLMKKLNLSELEVVNHIAEQMMNKPVEEGNDD
jgi:conjugative transfer ATPase